MLRLVVLVWMLMRMGMRMRMGGVEMRMLRRLVGQRVVLGRNVLLGIRGKVGDCHAVG